MINNKISFDCNFDRKKWDDSPALLMLFRDNFIHNFNIFYNSKRSSVNDSHRFISIINENIDKIL